MTSRKGKLIAAGFMPSEASKLIKAYKARDFHELPYLQNLIRSRRLYIANLRSRGYSEAKIATYVKKLYVKRGWLREEKRDIWAIIRAYRKKAIEREEYTPPPSPSVKGSHHPLVSKDLDKQRVHRGHSTLEKYARGRFKE